ncbi:MULTISPECIES: pyridoxamine 5'-phosphate oxidase family protein [unclassified Leeuwenhoekiella]|uniref:pyridoxamine 5'-phosphate oxidase family protein n=1 Tax=unclassified Leeuwenhoekiella TaxID=2615029 RepID=UPI000C5A02BE|nr:MULTISPECIES: pyridoxamine 5'-phosphate oxidase family protein [unclassified Leeuwenhoekiella]MBA82561.1 general stress protein [Leeuwenhoekiella sp.]|tara:strand:+ start:45947 stop:46447 length:501 start_codon:yes stop_codon:yes gene_type:complete
MSTKNLVSTEALEKLKELATAIDFAFMATDLSNQPIDAIPMSTKRVDDNGTIWFLSNANSDHNANIQKDSKVQLFYSKPGDFEFLSVYGEASITRDRTVLDELYGKSDDAWFEGKDDPNLTAIQFRPASAQYWDAKSNKLVSLLKIAYGAVTGEETDLGETGSLKV